METVTIQLVDYGDRVSVAAPSITGVRSKNLKTVAQVIESFIARMSQDDGFCIETAEWCRNNPLKKETNND